MPNNFELDEHCVLLWKLDDEALIVDSIGGNTLTNRGVVADTEDFKEGNASAAFVATETDRMEIADTALDSGVPLKNGESNKTMSWGIWFKRDLEGVTQYLIDKSQYSGGQYSFLIGIKTDNKLSLDISANGTSYTAYKHDTALVTGRWYYAGITYDGDNDDAYRIRIWDDTAQEIVGVDKTGIATDVFIGEAALQLGFASTLFTLTGNMDEVVCFDDILTVDEIDQLHAGTYGAAGEEHNVAIVEAASASDEQTGSLVTDAAIIEAASADDTPVAQVDYNVEIAETVSATDAQITDGSIYNPAIVEAANAEDMPVAQVDYDAVIEEAASASDEQNRSKAIDAAIVEAASAGDAQNALTTLIAAIVEAASASDTPVAQVDYVAIIVEAANAQDTSDGQLDEIAAAIIEAANAQDASNAQVDFAVAIIEAANAQDASEGNLAWDEIPPAMHAALIDPYSGGAWLWLVNITIPGYAVISLVRNPADVVHVGRTYQKNNFNIGLASLVADGSVPRITLQVVQDRDHTLEDKINATEGASGGTVQIIRAHEDFLTYDILPLKHTMKILTANSDYQHVNFLLGLTNPLLKKIPLRRYSSKICPYADPSLFKGPECQYPGDDPICSGLYEDCFTKGNAEHWGANLGLDPSTTRV